MLEKLEKFDKAVASVTQERGAIYGHPADDFQMIVDLFSCLRSTGDERIDHVLYMLCLKIARLSKAPDHLDSWIDIAGYARTAVMILERDDEERQNNLFDRVSEEPGSPEVSPYIKALGVSRI